MWGSVLALVVLVALNPIRLGITLLVISRPKPVPNLLVYWAGCLIGCIPAVVLPLTLLHVTPVFRSFAEGVAVSPTIRHIQVGMGLLALSVAALIAARPLLRRRQHHMAISGNAPSTDANSPAPNPLSRLLGHADDDDTSQDRSPFRRMLNRATVAWENGSLWVAFAIGLLLGGIEPDAGLFLIAILVTSGANTATQIIVAVVFALGVLAIVELTLISYLVAPAKTQAVVQLLHDWALTHRRKILIAMCIVAGISLLIHGLGGI
ncbi:gap protein [Mycobacteroides abscessus subsp. bolletii]|uniref:Gap protein n=1 Tax=Mycobacteroides abscessus subsp. bolletii TaxID=319705 RepID=A0A9Q7SHC4_9MYCO|nr:GAP family protein [Mycobacteroides abscessus]SHU73756.1 gap protein [Mycobacteroides abscessus subsp. bolletii]SHV15259.1 gap protein [Mycobacteroides abscessus subsp. bolletii]SHY00366.1 gap protein [Mycobacteroides abscessus subsp. bolletii]SKM74218.1 gap protein [Mycobacteroides abscessus subsp. bolletii]SKN01739.1 gap protein [Mycobacteroides abscessus subsp. bolletii]